MIYEILSSILAFVVGWLLCDIKWMEVTIDTYDTFNMLNHSDYSVGGRSGIKLIRSKVTNRKWWFHHICAKIADWMFPAEEEEENND